MKLPILLSQFLYQHKKLDLPSIGRFTLDPAAVLPEESDKGLHLPASGISFSNMTVHTPDSDLITYLHQHTGKMKPLAAADLDFFLTTGRQLLNIGKVFYLEGIGTLIKNKEGKLDFTPGEYAMTRLDESNHAKKDQTRHVVAQEAPAGHEPRSTGSGNMRQLLLLVGIVGGLVIIGWGGYSLYKRNTLPEPQYENSEVTKQLPAVIKTDSAHKDSASHAGASMAGASSPGASSPGATTPSGGPTAIPPSASPASPPATAAAAPVDPNATLYRFVILETTHKGRALRRYNQLLGFQLNIKMDQKDSSYFKLYFPITATGRDTTHIKDSLADVYAAHVTIER